LLSASLLALAIAAPAISPGLIHARDLAYRQEYDSALAITAAAVKGDPEDPAGVYWHAAILQLLIYDSGKGSLADSFFKLNDRALSLCRDRLDLDRGDAEAHFYLGMARLNRAGFLAWQSRIVPAFRAIVAAGPPLRTAFALDSSLADARLGLGMIEYFKAVSRRYTLGLRLFGSREKAYEAFQEVVDGGGAHKPAAEMMIAYMFKEDGDFRVAESCCRRLLSTYPGNRSTLRLERDLFLKSGQYAKALAVGAELDSALPRAFPDNKYGMAENWIVCGKASALAGDTVAARARFQRVLAWERYQAEVPWLPHYVREAKKWLKRL
jgi:tetratricopeptide (TPR) repeat protein